MPGPSVAPGLGGGGGGGGGVATPPPKSLSCDAHVNAREDRSQLAVGNGGYSVLTVSDARYAMATACKVNSLRPCIRPWQAQGAAEARCSSEVGAVR